MCRWSRSTARRSRPTRPDAAPGYASLEGYATAKLLVLALTAMKGQPTRAGLIDACETMHQVDLGGVLVDFSADNHQASREVFLTQVRGGLALPIVKLAK